MATLLTLILLTFAFTITSAFAVSLGGHTIEFVTREEDPSGYSTPSTKWTYLVTATEGTRKGISHWTIAWCGGEASILGWGWDGSTGLVMEYGWDPTLGIWGIKFEIPQGYDFKDVSHTFWFVLNGHYGEGLVDVGIKDGDGEYLGQVNGPIFSYGLTLTIEGTGPTSTYMKAVAETDYALVDTVTFYWYGPFGTEGTAGPYGTPLGNPVWTDVVSPRPFEATHIVTEDHLGYWYVNAIFTGGIHDGEADGILSLIVLVPWFTSLPMVLLVTVGAVFLFKRRGKLHT